MKNVEVVRAAAFDKDNRPITVSPKDWDAEIDVKRKKIRLVFSGNSKFPSTTLEYELDFAVLNVISEEEVEVSTTKATILGGLIASDNVSRGNIASQIFVANAANSMMQSTMKYTLELSMYDANAIRLEADGKEANKLVALAADDESMNEDILNLRSQIFKRVRDGERGLPELDSELKNLEHELDELKAQAMNGSTFEERDKASQAVAVCTTNIGFGRMVKQNTIFELALKKANDEGQRYGMLNRTKRKLKMWGAVVICVAGWYGFGLMKNASMGNGSAADTLPAASVKVEPQIAVSPPLAQPSAAIVEPVQPPTAPIAAANVEHTSTLPGNVSQQQIQQQPTPLPLPAAISPPIVAVAPVSAEKAPTIDEQYNERADKECGRGIAAFICREQLKMKLCDGKYSDSPAAGQSLCKATKQQ
jgi:hypothetical protein